jgi:hypothetical protein
MRKVTFQILVIVIAYTGLKSPSQQGMFPLVFGILLSLLPFHCGYFTRLCVRCLEICNLKEKTNCYFTFTCKIPFKSQFYVTWNNTETTALCTAIYTWLIRMDENCFFHNLFYNLAITHTDLLFHILCCLEQVPKPITALCLKQRVLEISKTGIILGAKILIYISLCG